MKYEILYDSWLCALVNRLRIVFQWMICRCLVAMSCSSVYSKRATAWMTNFAWWIKKRKKRCQRNCRWCDYANNSVNNWTRNFDDLHIPFLQCWVVNGLDHCVLLRNEDLLKSIKMVLKCLVWNHLLEEKLLEQQMS